MRQATQLVEEAPAQASAQAPAQAPTANPMRAQRPVMDFNLGQAVGTPLVNSCMFLGNCLAGQGRYSEPDTHILIGDELSGGAGRMNELTKVYNELKDNPHLSLQQRSDLLRLYEAGKTRLANAPKAHSLLDRMTGRPENAENAAKKNTILSKTIQAMYNVTNARLVQRNNPLLGDIHRQLAQQEARANSLGIAAYDQDDEDEDPVGPPQAIQQAPPLNPAGVGLGLGKLKFIKKYLRGQGLKATKKNVDKICNIMDVEGVVFE
jgi:hypothetical protein